MKTLIKEWLSIYDRTASAIKIWKNGDVWYFQACKGQQAYGHIFKCVKETHVSRLNVEIV